MSLVSLVNRTQSPSVRAKLIAGINEVWLDQPWDPSSDGALVPPVDDYTPKASSLGVDTSNAPEEPF
jgi:hypothetical protein